MNNRAPKGTSASSRARNGRHRSRARKPRKGIIIGLAVAGVLILGGVTWLATRLLVVKTDLEQAQQLVSELQTNATAFDTDAMSETASDLKVHSASAVAGTRDLTWRIAEFVPVLGENLKGVRAVAESVDEVVVQIAIPAVDIVRSLKPDANSTGLNLLTPVAQAQDVISAAGPVLERSGTKLAAIDVSLTLGPVSDAVIKMQDLVTSAAGTVTEIEPLVTSAGAILGQDAPRNYLMAFQNNAEATALGGSAASYTLINVDKGNISVAAQAGGSNDLQDGVAVDVDVDQSALDLYSDYLVRFPNTSTSRPDFPTAATIMQAFWARDKQVTVDGVISIDPIALSQILKATGPVTLNSGDVLSSDNAVSLLVNEIYFRYGSYDDYQTVDAFFQNAAATILTKITSGEFDVKTMITSLTDGINGGSIMAWSAKPEEQTLMDGLRIQGTMPLTNDDATVVGTFYRDISASKIDYYLETATETTTNVCDVEESPTFTTKVTLHSNLTVEQANDLPDYVKSQEFGSKLFATQVFVYGPVGATLAETSIDEEAEETVTNKSVVDLGRPVASFTAYIAPGQTAVVTARFTGGAGPYGPVEARGTPMINTTAQTLLLGSCGQ